MKYKIKSGVCLLLAAMLCVGGVGCGTGENGESGNENKPTVNGNEITLKTKDAAMTLEAGDTFLAIKSLKSVGGKEAVPAPSEFSLPNIIRTDAGKVKVTWDFVSAKTEEGTENGVGFQSAVFSFRGRDLPAELTVTVLARPTLPGPFEVRSQVKNTSDSPIRLLPGKFASLNVGQGGELVSIKKESGMSEGYTHYDGQHFDGTGIYRTEANADAAVSA